MKKHIILLFIFGTFSCSKISPGGFWTQFRQSEIVSKELDHGPYGGKTEIHWNANKILNANEIIKFAKVNDLELVDTAKVNLDFSNQILSYRFEKSELKNKTILYFKSNLLTIDEDERLETQVNCFAILNTQNTQLVLYYRWGDF